MNKSYRKMVLRNSILIFFSVIFLSANGQNKFILKGHAKWIHNGKVVLLEVAPLDFYSYVLDKDTIDLKEGFFSISGLKDDFPEQFRLCIVDSIGKKHISAPFFIDSGRQEIFIDSKRSLFDYKLNGNIVQSSSVSNIEYQDFFLTKFDSINTIIDAWIQKREQCYELRDSIKEMTCLKNLQDTRLEFLKTRDSILLNYTLGTKNKKIVLWCLYDFLKTFGYNNFYQKTYDISKSDSKWQISSYMHNFLAREKLKNTGNKLPMLEYIKKQLPDSVIEKGRYILVDLWFSNCAPCIAQFPIFNKLYAEYGLHGFSIVGISSDTNSSSWKKVIRKYNTKWFQIWDKDNVVGAALDIIKFPSNFLIDSNGLILFKDIGIIELQIFLKNNISFKE